jgi:hypothetical protein
VVAAEQRADRAVAAELLIEGDDLHLGCERECKGRVDVEDRINGCSAASEMEGPVRWGWWSSAAALRGEAANHRKVRRSRAGVLSVAEKARRERVRCGPRRRTKVNR